MRLLVAIGPAGTERTGSIFVSDSEKARPEGTGSICAWDGHHHAVLLALQEDHARRQLLPICWCGDRRMGVHVLLPAGDEGEEPRGYREALRWWWW